MRALDRLRRAAAAACATPTCTAATAASCDLIGLIVEATGLEAEVGEVCTIETGRGRAAPCPPRSSASAPAARC